ncbi:MAG: hypothetical protein ABIH46_02895 [Chloroflexota bacterium]
MYYARFTKYTVRQGCDAEAEQALGELYNWLEDQEGFLTGFRLVSPEHSRQRARLSIWKSKEAADAAAIQTHSIALRTRLTAVVKEEAFDYDVLAHIGRMPAQRKRKTS